MSLRIPVNNEALPGVFSEHTLTDHPSELSRCDIFLGETYIGQVSYVRRKSSYGWRPAKNVRAKLTNKVDAIRRLPKYAEQIKLNNEYPGIAFEEFLLICERANND